MARAFTRVTLLGPTRHLDLLLPSDQPVGMLIPQVLDLLQDTPAPTVAAKVLVSPSGDALDDAASLDEAGVVDGAMLSLFNASDAPPAAVVYDITDAVVEASSDTAGRWDERYRSRAAAVVAALSVWGATEILTALAGRQQWWLLLASAAVLLAAGALLGRGPGRPAVGPALLGAAWLGGLGGILLAPVPAAQSCLMAAALTVLTLAAVALLTQRPRALYSAAGTLALLTALWAGALAGTGRPGTAAAVATILSVLVLGMAPKIALSSSGLAALDDRRANGGTIGRVDAVAAIEAAHRGLALGTILCAASIASGLWVLGTAGPNRTWSLPLMLALILATALRARSFPLAAERLGLYLAAAVGTLALTNASLAFLPKLHWLVALALLLVAAAALAAVVLRLPDHVAARFRLLGNKVESIAIVASVPLALGMFGVFAQLLRSFG